MPWETPITEVYGQHLHGMTMGLRTELEVARAVDKGDLDAVAVHPLPAQERILDALVRLGFRFQQADVERGRIHGVQQTLPFYQEIEFYPAPQYAGAINQLELTFVATPQQLQVVLEIDKRGGLLHRGSRRVRPVHRRLRHRRPDRLGRPARRLAAPVRSAPRPVLLILVALIMRW